MNFKPGQKVVYIERSLPDIGLIKNEIYTVLDTADCNCAQNIHVGIINPHAFVRCADCGAIINIDDRWFLNSDAFRLLSENEVLELEESFEKVTKDI